MTIRFLPLPRTGRQMVSIPGPGFAPPVKPIDPALDRALVPHGCADVLEEAHNLGPGHHGHCAA